MSLRHLFADEIGLENAVLAGWRLQATHTPVYGRAGPGQLVPQAVIGGLTGRRVDGGAWAEPAELEESLGRGRAALLALSLALRNHRHAAGDGLRLFVDLSARLAARPSLARSVIRDLHETGLSARDIVVFPDAGDDWTAPQRETVGLLAEAGIGLGLPAAAYSRLGGSIRADVLRIDPPWLRAAIHDASARELLGHLIASCHGKGGAVFASSLQTEEELDLAYVIGCDLFEGPVLAGRRLAGAEIGLEPRLAGRASPFQRYARPS